MTEPIGYFFTIFAFVEVFSRILVGDFLTTPVNNLLELLKVTTDIGASKSSVAFCSSFACVSSLELSTELSFSDCVVSSCSISDTSSSTSLSVWLSSLSNESPSSELFSSFSDVLSSSTPSSLLSILLLSSSINSFSIYPCQLSSNTTLSSSPCTIESSVVTISIKEYSSYVSINLTSKLFDNIDKVFFSSSMKL